MKRFPLSPDRFFLLVSLLFGGALVFVNPPFQVPDEPVHFYRAWDISQGHLVTRRQPGRIGGELPASLWKLEQELVNGMPGNVERKITVGQIRAGLSVPLDPGVRTFLAFPNAAIYTFVPYIPQTLVILAGRGLGAPPLATFYAARLATLLAATFLTAYAIRRAPALRWLLVLIALTPMALHQRASVSADALTIAAAFVLGALAARLAFREGGPADAVAGRRDFLLLTAAALGLCLCKPAYVLLGAGALCLVPASRVPGGRRSQALAGLALGLVFVAALAGSRFSESAFRPGVGVDSPAQIHDAVREPLRFLGVVVHDYWIHADRYLVQLVGQLGWLDVKLPVAFLAVYLFFLLAFGLLDGLDGEAGRTSIAPWQRGVLAVAVLGTLLLVSASQYAVWTPYRSTGVEGLQGRYFLPVAPIAVWLFHLRPGRLSAWAGTRLGWAAAGLTALSAAVTFHALIERFYG
jgi:uncharacterized membrane protein